MGMRQPFQVTVDTLRWLLSCDEVFNYLPDSNVLEFLSLFSARKRSVSVRPGGDPAAAAERAIMPRLRGPIRVAFVTRGNAMMYGRVPRHLARQCRVGGLSCRATTSLSMFELAPALAASPPPARAGLQVRNFFSIDRPIDPRRPLVVYFPAEREDARRVARRLARWYGPRHPCSICVGAGGNEMTLRRLPLRNLGAALEAGDPGSTLYLPPKS
jgi:hypothetical protein